MTGIDQKHLINMIHKNAKIVTKRWKFFRRVKQLQKMEMHKTTQIFN